MFKKKDLYKLVNWTRYSVKNAAKVLTISKASKADIIKEYKIDPTKVEVVYPGRTMSLKTQKHKNTETILKKYSIKDEYILYVGTLQPRKNLIGLIDAFSKLKAQSAKRKTKAKKLKLVIVGKKGWMYEEIFAKVRELGLEKNVIFTGFVKDEDLLAFYQKAKCLVLVSLYEGFGLPVLEAMSYGVPVVVSNVSSLPEVAGEAGVFVDPEDTEDIANGILKILSMDNSDYKELSDRCERQAKKFSWEKCARETLKVLEEAANKYVK